MSVLLPALLFGGCRTAHVGLPPEVPPRLAKAQELYQQEKYTDAMIECIDLARKDPLMPGLAELQQKIVTKLSDQRAALATMRASNTHKLMGIDVDKHKDVPDTYGIRRAIHSRRCRA